MQRSYSIASPPEDPRVALTIERLEDGEVSTCLSGEVRSGDKLELRGPIGGYFGWDVAVGGPLILVAGGSGIVPLMAMLRHRDAALANAGSDARSQLRARLLYSSRGWDEIIYREELARLVEKDTTLEVAYTLTRDTPGGWSGFRGRIDRSMLEEFGWPPSEQPLVFVCGPTQFAEAATAALIDLGHPTALVKTQCFGLTGEPV
jgi:ferredoxin-NADP reductase